MLFGQPALHDWSDGVDDELAGQIVGRRDFRCTCRFFMPLCFHDFRTFQPQTNPGKGMDTVIAKKVLRITRDITKIIEEYYNVNLDTTGITYSRFITHAKYLALRYINHSQIEEQEDNIFTLNPNVVEKTKEVIGI